MAACPGYLVETLGGERARAYPFHPEASTCAHLAPQQVAHGRLVPVCEHPEAEWIVPAARRMKGSRLIRAEVTASHAGGHHALDLLDRAFRAQLRASRLCGTTWVLLLVSHLESRARSDHDRAGLVPRGR